MRGYSTMTDEERQNILSQHKTVYDGYATLQGKDNMTPLTVGDYALDKGGINVTNTGEVKPYSNIMKESKEVTEIEADDMDVSDVEPGYDYESGGPEQFEPSGDDADPYDMDLGAIQNMFDFEDIYGSDNDASAMMALQKKMDGEFDGKEDLAGEKSAYNFDSEGGNVDVYGESNNEEGEVILSMYDEIDEDLHESFKDQRNKILETFNKFKKYN